MRAVVSKKNRNWMPKHRYYELKHFCLQYHDWIRQYNDVSIKGGMDPTGDEAIRLAKLRERIDAIDQSIDICPKELRYAIKEHVTRGRPYESLEVFCCRTAFYAICREFYGYLEKIW